MTCDLLSVSMNELRTNEEREIVQHEDNRHNGTLLSYQGPIPPASEFAKYEEVLKGSADRILGMAEEQSKHRQSIEKRVILFGGIQSLLGTVFAVIVAVVGIAVGGYLILQDKQISGFAAMLGPLGTIILAFIYQKRHKNTDSE